MEVSVESGRLKSKEGEQEEADFKHILYIAFCSSEIASLQLLILGTNAVAVAFLSVFIMELT